MQLEAVFGPARPGQPAAGGVPDPHVRAVGGAALEQQHPPLRRHRDDTGGSASHHGSGVVLHVGKRMPSESRGRAMVLVDGNKTDQVDAMVAAIQKTDTLDWAVYDTSDTTFSIVDAPAINAGSVTRLPDGRVQFGLTAPGAAQATPMKSGYVYGALALAAALVLYFGILPGKSLEMAARAGKSLGKGQLWWTFTRGTPIGGMITSASTDAVALADQPDQSLPGDDAHLRGQGVEDD